MAPKKTVPNPAAIGQLKHNPFAQLAARSELISKLGQQSDGATVAREKPAKPSPPLSVRMRLESTGRSGKVVTRISGLPLPNLHAIAQRLRKGLGCGASVEGDDVLLQGSLRERAQEWFDRAGDLRAITDESARATPREALHTQPLASPTCASAQKSATERHQVRRGRRVAIVLKADQDTGKLTQGVVQDVLTNSDVHPRGIKVRLESGEVGRVKIILA